MSADTRTNAAIKCKRHDEVTVSHARRLIGVYADDKDHPWYFEWAQTIVRLADELDELDALRAENGSQEPSA